MAEEKKFLRKALLVGAALSFPVGVLILAAPDEWFARFQPKPLDQPHRIAAMVQKSFALETQAVKQMDLDLLKARGEVLKLREMREQKITQLQGLQDQLVKLIAELQLSEDSEVEVLRSTMVKSYSAGAISDQRKSR